MSRQVWKGSTLLNPEPPVLVPRQRTVFDPVRSPA